MSGYFVLKTEPSTYSFDDLRQEGTATWDGVKNPVALKHIRSMSKGDELLIYHTGSEKACVGLARVVSDPYPDPKNPRLVVFDLKAGKPLSRPVTLAEIKSDAAFAGMALVRQGRLSVVPATKKQWDRLLKLGAG